MVQELRGEIARVMPDLAAEAGLPIPPKTCVPPTPDFESWEQVEYRLTRYVEAHADDLRADMTKYGDVRTQPGFDPQARGPSWNCCAGSMPTGNINRNRSSR